MIKANSIVDVKVNLSPAPIPDLVAFTSLQELHHSYFQYDEAINEAAKAFFMQRPGEVFKAPAHMLKPQLNYDRSFIEDGRVKQQPIPKPVDEFDHFVDAITQGIAEAYQIPAHMLLGNPKPEKLTATAAAPTKEECDRFFAGRKYLFRGGRNQGKTYGENMYPTFGSPLPKITLTGIENHVKVDEAELRECSINLDKEMLRRKQEQYLQNVRRMHRGPEEEYAIHLVNMEPWNTFDAIDLEPSRPMGITSAEWREHIRKIIRDQTDFNAHVHTGINCRSTSVPIGGWDLAKDEPNARQVGLRDEERVEKQELRIAQEAKAEKKQHKKEQKRTANLLLMACDRVEAQMKPYGSGRW